MLRKIYMGLSFFDKIIIDANKIKINFTIDFNNVK